MAESSMAEYRGIPFKHRELTNLLQRVKTGAGTIRTVEKYLLSTLFKTATPLGFSYIDGSTGVTVWLEMNKMSTFIPKGYEHRSVTINENTGKAEVVTFNVASWFVNSEVPEFHTIVCDPSKPRVYEKNGDCYFNRFIGFKYESFTLSPYQVYSQHLRDGVDTIFNHIRTVWCSGIESAYHYNALWIANVVCGRRMHACIYNKSEEGTGKSAIIDFLADKVLGRKITVVTSSTESITGTFNQDLEGAGNPRNVSRTMA
jgi:hypothetical protein